MAMNPTDVVVMGVALETDGFTANDTIAGLGLMTFGFLWPCDGVWQSSDDLSLVTPWVPASIPSSTTEVCQDDNGGLYA